VLITATESEDRDGFPVDSLSLFHYSERDYRER